MKTTFLLSLKHLAVLLLIPVGLPLALCGCQQKHQEQAADLSDFNFSQQPTTNGTNNEVKS
ncbi:MAG: hypothetical protein ABL974_12815 [Prosthecobacter sp.]